MGSAIAFGLYTASVYSYLLFHSLAEIFSVTVAGAIFMVAWNSRRFTDDGFLLFLGIAYLFIGVLDLLHTLAYVGMGVFPDSGANLATQLWIAARYAESFSLLAAPVLIGRKFRPGVAFAAYGSGCALLLLSIFRWEIFPDCFIEGSGLTAFKKGSEYVISALLAISAAALYWRRDRLEGRVLRLLLLSIAATIASELSLTFYTSAYGVSNLVGHILKIVSFTLIYRAIVETGLARPYDLLFRELAQSREEILRSHRELEDRVRERTAELARANEALRDHLVALARSESKFRAAIESLPIPILVVGEDGDVLYMNAVFTDLTGYGPRDLGTLDGFLGKLPGMDGERRERFLRALAGGAGTRAVDHGTCSLTTAEGKDRTWAITTCSIVTWDDCGATLVVGNDRTEKEALEKQLLQAQKMEAIGRLAGGVAHDMNNYLGAISTVCEASRESDRANDDLRRRMDLVIRTVNKASSLVKQLLAFCRRQPVRPRPIDLNDTVRGMETILRRLAGDAVPIVLNLGRDLWRVESDPSQMEQILLNLCVNSRDAMPQGGTITVETANVELTGEYLQTHPVEAPGEYVMLSVTDAGTGIPPEIRDKIFEPFFTTKEKGTGLGLSSVYGIVKQNGGYIWLYSEAGRGTTFKTYLPRHGGGVRPPAEVHAEAGAEGIAGTRILLVEDNAEYRDSIQGTLMSQGCDVVSAGSGEEAIAVLERERAGFDLLLTDVVMPGMGGLGAAGRIREKDAGIRVLFLSGYPENVFAPHGVLPEGVDLLQKPFAMAELLRRIREALAREPEKGRPN